MEKLDNTGLGLILKTIERVRNEKSLFASALKKLVNSNEEELDDFLKRKSESKNRTDLLRLISGGQPLVLRSLNGGRQISNAKKTFKRFIDSNFKNWGIDKPGIATPETPVSVYEVVRNGKLIDIFSALPGTWGQKWVSQDQVIEFCEALPVWLRQEGRSTLFLIKKDERKGVDENNPHENLAVVGVGVYPDGLHIVISWLDSGVIWDGSFLRRVVAPRFSPKDKVSQEGFLLGGIVSTCRIPASDDEFIARDKFVINTGKDAKVKIYHIHEDFEKWFLGKTEAPHAGSTIYGRQLNKNLVDGPILSYLGGQEKAETTLAEIHALMESQPDGKAGDLLSNGAANIFYVRDINCVQRAVSVDWDDRGWGVDAFTVENQTPWVSGFRVFSRNSLGTLAPAPSPLGAQAL